MNSGTAFRFVDGVKSKIESLVKHSDNSLDSQCLELLKLVYKQVVSFEEFAKTTLDTDLDKSISVEARKLEGIVDEIVSDGVELSREEEDNLKQRIQSFTPRLEMEVQRCSDGLYNLIPTIEEEEEKEEEDDPDVVSSNVIGMSDVYQELKDKLLRDRVTSLVGMPGVGKTTLANKLFHDPVIVEHFDHRVWVRVGKNCRVKDIPRLILAKVDPLSVLTLPGVDEEEIHDHLMEKLKSERYLFVLDDVWDRFTMFLLHPYYRYGSRKQNHPFLHPESESRFLLTSRLQQLNQNRLNLIRFKSIVDVRLLNKKESWDLLCETVFSKGSSCPPQIEKAGKKISENCDGLPLTILTVARLLSNEETSTPEYWNAVAAKKNHQIFMDAYNEISKVLLSSYTYLSRILQMCFLFIGLFPRNHEIPRSKLINLWMADGFFELNVNINSVFDAVDCLEELVSNSIVMVYKKSTLSTTHTVKSCGLHTSLWHLSRKKDRETKFALVVSSPNDCSGDGMEGHHRLSFNNNVLFGMKDVNKSVEDNCASTVRALLCFGLYHKYQVPLCFRLKLLRELDALSIRFYEFPMEVLQLVRLRYLALTSNGIIPSSISQLSNLQFLIVDRHQSIKTCRDQSYLPVEIWGLQDLRLLQVMGGDLPDPCGASLKSLQTLSNVSTRSCTEAILKGLPCLRELKIRIELAPNDDGKPMSCFTHISYLCNLEFLKCVIVNPEVVPPIVPFSSFPPSYLTSLSLSGLAYPWIELRKIASLPYLKMLKLKNYAFQGPEWRVEERGFINLYSLVIEDTDLVDWQFGCGAFESLRSLTIKCCFKLEKVRGVFGKLLIMVELFDCNPLCAEEMKRAVPKEAKLCVLNVHSSWGDVKLKTHKFYDILY